MSGPRYQHFFDLPAAQYEALKKDIEARGLVLPILVDEDDKTIDGHMRRRACGELHIDCPRIVVEGLSEDEKHSLAIACNLFRRQLGGVERTKAIGEMSRLGLSQRRIAEAIGVSVGTVNKDLQVFNSEHLSGAAPAGVDPATGEIKGEPSPAAEGSSDEATGSPESAGAGVPATRKGAAPDTTEPSDSGRGGTASPAPSSARVKGKDGKSYPAKTKRSTKRASISDAAQKAGWDFRKAVERLVALAKDDRFAANKEQVAAHWCGHLSYSVEVCQDLLGQLSQQSQED